MQPKITKKIQKVIFKKNERLKFKIVVSGLKNWTDHEMSSITVSVVYTFCKCSKMVKINYIYYIALYL